MSASFFNTEKITNKETQEELWSVEHLFEKGEDLQDNQCIYFPVLKWLKKALEEWIAKFPEVDNERKYLHLIERAEDKERLAFEVGLYGESDTREDRIAFFTRQAVEFKKRAAEAERELISSRTTDATKAAGSDEAEAEYE